MIPISDDNPHDQVPIVTWTLMAACIGVFLWQLGLGPSEGQAFIYSYGVIPAVLLGGRDLDPGLVAIPAWATVFSSMFLHGGLLHLAGNMLYLWIFGDNVEAAMGRVRFLIFYLACGVAAALTQSLLNTDSTIPMVGASGAISGVLGAYLILYPRAHVRVLLWFFYFVRIVAVPAMVVLGLWFALQLFSGLAAPSGEGGGVAFWAHVGGFVAGMALVMAFKKPIEPSRTPASRTAYRPRPGRRAGPWDRRP